MVEGCCATPKESTGRGLGVHEDDAGRQRVTARASQPRKEKPARTQPRVAKRKEKEDPGGETAGLRKYTRD